MDAVTRELQNPTERTRERLQFISEFEQFARPTFLHEQLIASLSVSSASAYMFWEEVITSRRDQLSQQTRTALTDTALQLAEAASSATQRKPSLLKLAIEFCPKLSPVEQSSLARRVLELLWNADETIRNAAAGVVSILRANANQGDVRIHFNAGIHEHLQRVGLSTFPQYQPVIDVLVANKDLWNESASRSITQLAITLSSSDSLRVHALALLESVADFGDGDLQDVIHILKTIESGGEAQGERAQKLLQRITVGSGGV